MYGEQRHSATDLVINVYYSLTHSLVFVETIGKELRKGRRGEDGSVNNTDRKGKARA